MVEAMTAPLCTDCRRREEIANRSVCACTDNPRELWDTLLARKSGPCGPAGKMFLGSVEVDIKGKIARWTLERLNLASVSTSQLAPPPHSDWRARRAGCLVCAIGSILFWLGVWFVPQLVRCK